MVHKYFGGVVPEAGAETAAEAALRESAVQAIAAFGPAFDELNFSEALKSLWVLVAETDGYLTANAPWKKPADRSEAEHARCRPACWPRPPRPFASSPRWFIPSCPSRPPRSGCNWARARSPMPQSNAFLTHLAWGGLQAGTKFGEPAPLFPRAEKDAVERMQKIEEENNLSAD